MALYDYICSECKHEFTEKQSIANRKTACALPCPSCKSEDTISIKIHTVTFGYHMRTPGMQNTENFKDRMKELKKGKGEGCTIDF